MKLKEFFFLTGLRPKPKTYSFAVNTFHLPVDGEVFYAQWLHPKEQKKKILQEEVDELRTFLSPGDVAIDIGAHTGDSTLPIALAVGSKGVVIALEPNPFVFRILETNAYLNPRNTKIIPLNFAATAVNGEFDSHYSDSGFCNGGIHEGVSPWTHFHAFKLRILGRNLADVLALEYAELLPQIRYIKVDTEGHDATVLATLTSVISQTRPFIRAEVYRHLNAQKRQDFFRMVANLGYAIHRRESPTRYVGMRLAEADLMRWEHYDIFCMPQ